MMGKRTFVSACLCLLLGFSAGCYFEDRARDFADCFRLSGGLTLGAVAEARVLQLGYGVGYGQSIKCGIETKGRLQTWSETAVGLPVTTVIGIVEGDGRLLPLSYSRVLEFGGGEPIRQRECAYDFLGNLLADTNGPWLGDESDTETQDYFWIEAGAGALVNLRAGVNVAELLDFILGLSTFDIFGDDNRSAHEPFFQPPEALEETRRKPGPGAVRPEGSNPNLLEAP